MSGGKVISVLAFPVLLSIGIFLIPVVSDYSDHELAAQAVGKTDLWVAGHLISAMGVGLSGWASCTVVDELHRGSSRVPSFILPFIGIGAGLYAAGLGVDGLGPVIVNSSGASPVSFFDASGWYVSGVFMLATFFFAIVLISLVIHVIRDELVAGPWRSVVFISALVFVSAPAIPSGWGLYGEALAALGVFVPIGISIGRSS